MVAHQAGCCCGGAFDCPCCEDAPTEIIVNFGIGPFWTANPFNSECDACETIQGEFTLTKNTFRESLCKWRYQDEELCLDSNVSDESTCPPLDPAGDFFKLRIEAIARLGFRPGTRCRLSVTVDVFGGLLSSEDADDCTCNARIQYDLNEEGAVLKCKDDSPFVLNVRPFSERAGRCRGGPAELDHTHVCAINPGMPPTITVDFRQ